MKENSVDFQRLEIIKCQLKELTGTVDQIEAEKSHGSGMGFIGSGITHHIPIFNHLLSSSKDLLKNSPSLLYTIEFIQPIEHFDEDLASNYHVSAKQAVLGRARALLAALKGMSSSSVNIPNMKVLSDGIFFSGQPFDAMNAASDILNSALNSIIVIDAYAGPEVLSLLQSKVIDNISEIKILVKQVKSELSTLCKAFQKQHNKLEVKKSNDFHDRFVILDHKDIYHFGTSIDSNMGNRGFMFSKLEEGFMVDVLLKKFNDSWNSAVQVDL